MPATTKKPPRLKNLDDLFMLNGGVNPLDKPETEPEKQPTQHTRQQSVIPINQLEPFAEHPFRLYTGERLDDMVESIRSNGVLVPIIVRRTSEICEILAGHNRVNAAKLAGLTTIPAIILENIPDDEAWIYVVETNLMQRSFSDMAHSEKAAVIATQHSKLFSQGKRNDILVELKKLESPHEYRDRETCAQVAHKMKSRDIVAQEYGLSKDTVARYLRIHRLISELKTRLDDGEIAFIPSVTLSFLKDTEQSFLDKCIGLNGFAVDMKKADTLRQYSEKGKLNEENIYLILSGEVGQKQKPNRTPTVKVSKAVYTKYFKPNQSPQEIQGIVEKALDMYFSQ